MIVRVQLLLRSLQALEKVLHEPKRRRYQKFLNDRHQIEIGPYSYNAVVVDVDEIAALNVDLCA